MNRQARRARNRTPGIPAANQTPSASPIPTPDGYIPFGHADGRVDQMPFWNGPDAAHTARAAASLEG